MLKLIIFKNKEISLEIKRPGGCLQNRESLCQKGMVNSSVSVTCVMQAKDMTQESEVFKCYMSVMYYLKS